jgi:hypothetical protein
LEVACELDDAARVVAAHRGASIHRSKSDRRQAIRPGEMRTGAGKAPAQTCRQRVVRERLTILEVSRGLQNLSWTSRGGGVLACDVPGSCFMVGSFREHQSASSALIVRPGTTHVKSRCFYRSVRSPFIRPLLSPCGPMRPHMSHVNILYILRRG